MKLLPKRSTCDLKTINLNNIKPNVFSESEISGSEIWCRNVCLETGKKYLISAESGKGKSSMFDFVFCRRNDYSGSMMFDGQDVKKLGKKQIKKIRTTEISIVFQGFRLFTELSAFENIKIKNCLTNHKNTDEIEQMFEKLGITEKMNQPLGKLSFGQQQRVAIIRALCQPFNFLFIDEAFSHLDSTNTKTACELIESEVQKQKASLVVSSLGDTYNFNYDKKYML